MSLRFVCFKEHFTLLLFFFFATAGISISPSYSGALLVFAGEIIEKEAGDEKPDLQPIEMSMR